MGRIACPSCGADLPPDDINVREGVALCRACNTITRLIDLADQAEPVIDADPSTPPPGCQLIDDEPRRIVVRASARSLSGAAGAGCFAVFWNSIVLVFVLIALAGTWQHVIGPVPSWFPAPNFGSGGAGSGQGQGQMMPLGMVIFLWIFLTPFILVGATMAFVALVSLGGRVEVRLEDALGIVRTAVGPLAWRRRFDASNVKAVRIGETSWKQNGQSKPVVEIEADRTVRFGSMLTDERRAWMVAVLKRLLVESSIRR